MKEISEIIDAWLDNTLPEAERRQVEQRMATDETFRREVEFQKALRQAFDDPGRFRLFTALEDAMQESLPDDDVLPDGPVQPAKRSLPIWSGVIIVILLGIGIWYLMKPAANTPVNVTTPGQEIPGSDDNTVPQRTNEENSNGAPGQDNGSMPQQKPIAKEPIAQANAENFKENLAMEGQITLRDVRSANELSVVLTTPQASAVMQPDPKGKTRIHFSGNLSGAAPNETVAMNLLLFNNRNANTPLLTLPLQFTADAFGKAVVEHQHSVEWPRGLYYYRLEEQNSGEALVVGRFLIGKK